MREYKYQEQKWTEEYRQWLLEHKQVSPRKKYALFCEAFPDADFTYTAVQNQCSRIGAISDEMKKRHKSTAGRQPKPLYHERQKKGYWQIKVAQPNVWWSKAKWVYVETHPEYLSEALETDAFYFLDGNNQNFALDNIAMVHRREQLVLRSLGGVVKGNPEQTLLNIAAARLKILMLDKGEEFGLVKKYGKGRAFQEEYNRKNRERSRKRYAEDPEYRKRIKEYSKESNEKRKEQVRAYKREWQRKKREEKKNDGRGNC